MTTSAPLDDPVDGRTARALRTRDALVDACLDLIDEGDLRPTAPRIAERAGVSVRSVFSHFADLESLFSAVGQQVTVRLSSIIRPIDPATPRSARIEAFVAQRVELLEAVTPVLRASLVHAATSAAITRQYEAGHAMFRRQVRTVFAPELSVTAEPDRLHDALVLTASWPAWNVLRQAEGRSVAEASSSMAWALVRLLGGGTAPR